MADKSNIAEYGGESGKKAHGGRSKSRCCCCYCTRRVKFIIIGAISLPILVVVCLISAVLINTAVLSDPYERMVFSETPSFMSNSTVEKLERAWNLAGAIKIQTISFEEGDLSLSALDDLGAYIEQTFPALHNEPDIVEFQLVNGYSRLYRIEGSEVTKNPYLLTAHLDVVPEGERDQWRSDPFDSGVIDNDQTIYGRGAIDDKHSVFGIMEALEYMISKAERPKRTLYLGFGHDEEVGGVEGAAKIAEELKKMLDSHGETLDFLLDEGMFVMEDVMPGVSDPMIYIGVAEKGWTTLELVVEGEQVHSSIPPKESTIGILARAVSELERHPQPSRFGKGPEVDTVRYAAPHADFLYKMALGNLWLTADIISSVFAADSETDSVQRTTTAITIFNAGIKENVVPGRASAIVNHRIHPADDSESVLSHDRKTVDDERVVINQKGYQAPTPVSPYDSDSIPFQVIAVSALEVYPTAHPVPGTMVANTDTLHYTGLTDTIYRFSPVIMNLDSLSKFHGIDESLSVDEYDQVVQFYYRLINNADYDIKSA